MGGGGGGGEGCSESPLDGIGLRVVRGESITKQRIGVQYIHKIIPATVHLLQNFTTADCNSNVDIIGIIITVIILISIIISIRI